MGPFPRIPPHCIFPFHKKCIKQKKEEETRTNDANPFSPLCCTHMTFPLFFALPKRKTI